MARVLGIDYGQRKTGLAATDSLQIIASAIDTIETTQLLDFLKRYLAENEVECIVIGEPTHADGNPTFLTPEIHAFAKTLEALYPHLKIVLQDERYTTLEARNYIKNSGMKKSKQNDRKLVDKIAAAIIIEEYMKENGIWERY